MTKNSNCAMYDFRIGNENLSYNSVMNCLKGIAKRFVFQLEEGTKTKYEHFQGRLSLYHKKRPHLATKLFLTCFKDIELNGGWYIQPTTGEEFLKGSFNYQMKLDTRIDGPWSDKDLPSYVPRHIRNITPRPFQKQVLDTMHVYDDRHINCIIDPQGNKGKSYLAAFIRNAGGITVPCCGDTERLVATVCDILIGKQTRQPRLVAIDLPRSVNNNRITQLMTSIEIIKDGWVYDMRHSFKEWTYDKPHVWVFTNNDMPCKYFSSDRWIFWRINANYELVRREASPTD